VLKSPSRRYEPSLEVVAALLAAALLAVAILGR
jgi:hypothetical protein